MNAYWQLKVGDEVVARNAHGDYLRVRVCQVPRDWRDGSGSHATTSKGAFPKAWVRRPGAAPVPWPVEDLHWPAQLPQGVEVGS